MLNFEVLTGSLEAQRNTEFEQLCSNYSVSTEELNEIVAALHDADVSTEALIGLFNRIGDVILGLTRTFRSIVLTGGKRSELKYWFDKNSMKVNLLEKQEIEEYKDVKVDIPSGMKGSYIDVGDLISKSYNAVDVHRTVSQGVSLMDSIMSSISQGSDSHEGAVELENKILVGRLKVMEGVQKGLNKSFTANAKGVVKKHFGTVASSFDELRGVRVGMMNHEQVLLRATEVTAMMDTMANSVEKVVSFLGDLLDGSESDGYAPSKQFIKQLADYVRNTAIVLENHSSVLTRQLTVEHNLILVYTELIKQ